MSSFELESVSPISDRLHPRQAAREAIEQYRAKPDQPVCNQHGARVRPSLEVDDILKASIRLTDLELENESQ